MTQPTAAVRYKCAFFSETLVYTPLEAFFFFQENARICTRCDAERAKSFVFKRRV